LSCGFFFFFETGSHYAALAGLELTIPLLQLPEPSEYFTMLGLFGNFLDAHRGAGDGSVHLLGPPSSIHPFSLSPPCAQILLSPTSFERNPLGLSPFFLGTDLERNPANIHSQASLSSSAKREAKSLQRQLQILKNSPTQSL
jgi:hypothetical protein